MYKGCFNSLTKKLLILTYYVRGIKDLVHISQSARPIMTVLHCANGSCKGIFMYSIVHFLVLGSLVLFSLIFLTVYILYIFLYFYIFPIASIHDTQRAK